MAINVSVQYNGGLLSDIEAILLTLCYYHRRHKEVLPWQPMFPVVANNNTHLTLDPM